MPAAISLARRPSQPDREENIHESVAMVHLDDYLAALMRLRSLSQTIERLYSQTAARALLAAIEDCLKLLDDCEPFLDAHRDSCQEIRKETRQLEFELRETLQKPTPVHQEALVQRVRQWIVGVDRHQQDLFPGSVP